MGQKVNNLEKIFVGIFVVILTLGFFLHKGLQKSININNEQIISESEKDYIKEFIKEYDEFKEQEGTYLRYLESEKKAKNDYNVARINYLLGINSYLNEEYRKAKEYFLVAKEEFVQANNYFYILNINNYLMKIFSGKQNYIEELRVLYETYEMLRNKNIRGIDDDNIKNIKITTISGLLKISSSLEMFDVSTIYYRELMELTKESRKDDTLVAYAKYFYNLKAKNFILAEEYAKEFIRIVKSVKKHEELAISKSYMPLLDVYVESGDFQKVKEPFEKVNKTFRNKEGKDKAKLLMVEALYSEKVEKDFTSAFKLYEQAFSNFEKDREVEGMLQAIENIISLRDYVELDLIYYINKLKEIDIGYNREENIGKIADVLNTMSREWLEVEQNEIIQISNIKSQVIKVTLFMGFIYLIIIMILLSIMQRFRKEVMKREQKEKEIIKMDKKDILTGAYTKQYLFNKIENYIEKEEKFNFILIDIDNLKSINDKYTHSYGDEVLFNIIEEIKESIIEFGYVGRIGGDEFAIVLHGNVNVRLITNLIRDKINHKRYGTEKIKVTLSGGGLQWNGETIDQIINEADKILMEAKANGKDRIIFK